MILKNQLAGGGARKVRDQGSPFTRSLSRGRGMGGCERSWSVEDQFVDGAPLDGAEAPPQLG